MIMKRKRTKTPGVMVAWSNGETTHVIPSETASLHHEFQQKIEKYKLVECHLYRASEIEYLAMQRSLAMEQYSDALWNLDLHLASFQQLLCAALEALVDYSVYIDADEVPYSHPNLVAFRRLVYRCKDRIQQDPSLKPVYEGSAVRRHYKDMIDTYTQYW